MRGGPHPPVRELLVSGASPLLPARREVSFLGPMAQICVDACDRCAPARLLVVLAGLAHSRVGPSLIQCCKSCGACSRA
jgi:hypothetical protein